MALVRKLLSDPSVEGLFATSRRAASDETFASLACRSNGRIALD